MIIQKNIIYQYNNQLLESILVAPEGVSKQLPALIMVPNWFGITAEAISLASQQAQQGYIVFIADLYGKNIRPQNNKEASDAMLPLRNNRQELRLRMQKALNVLIAQADEHCIDADNIAAFGFCFGGCCVLELARSGVDIKATISFHGNLDTPDEKDARNIKGSILVLNGASDPFVPELQLADFIREMNASAIDWQMINYGGAVHGFTDTLANEPGIKQYNARVAKRAFDAMNNLLDEVFSKK